MTARIGNEFYLDQLGDVVEVREAADMGESEAISTRWAMTDAPKIGSSTGSQDRTQRHQANV